MNDKFVGNLTFVRVYSGVLKQGDAVYNPVKSKRERSVVSCKCTQTNVKILLIIRAGDIAAWVLKTLLLVIHYVIKHHYT